MDCTFKTGHVTEFFLTLVISGKRNLQYEVSDMYFDKVLRNIRQCYKDIVNLDFIPFSVTDKVDKNYSLITLQSTRIVPTFVRTSHFA